MSKRKIERRRLIIFAFVGKNNKTETHYFSHFRPKDNRYDLKCFSCGVTDPQGMINSAKAKRKDLDYNPKYDLTFVFVDCDGDEDKRKYIEHLQSKQKRDLKIIKSNPSFETWFLNHFHLTTKEFENANKIIEMFSKYLKNYDKNKDYFEELKQLTDVAIKNSRHQLNNLDCKTFSEVVEVIEDTLVYK